MRTLEKLIRKFLEECGKEDRNDNINSALAYGFEIGFRTARGMAASHVAKTHQVRKDLISMEIEKLGEDKTYE